MLFKDVKVDQMCFIGEDNFIKIEPAEEYNAIKNGYIVCIVDDEQQVTVEN